MRTDPPSPPPRRDDLSSPSVAPLGESEQRYRTLFGAMEEGFCVVEMLFDDKGKPADYQFLEFNAAFERMTGIAAESALGGKSARELYPTLEEFWYETYGRVATTGESVRFENRAEAMGKWFEVHAFRIGGEGSREVGILFKDVSERRLADLERERLLVEAREREAFLKLITDRLPVRVGYLGRDYRYRFVNGAYERAFGVPPGSGVGMSVEELAGEEAFRIAKPFLDRALAGDTHTQEFDAPYALGQRRVEVQYVADRDEAGEVRGVVVHVLDVTDRHATNEALREREERYRTLFDALEEGFCVFEMIFDEAGKPVDYRFREVNAAFAAQTGLCVEDVLGGKTMREMAPDHEQAWYDRYGRVVTTGEPLTLEDRAEAMGKWFEVHAFRIGGEGSREVGALFADVTRRREAQTALLHERARQDATLEAAQVATFDWDVPNDLLYGNPLLNRFFGIVVPDGEGVPVARYFESIHPEDRGAVGAALQGSMERADRYEIQYRVFGLEGSERWILTRGDTTYGGDGLPARVSGVVLNVTDRVQAEQALRESEARRTMALDSGEIAFWNLDLTSMALTSDERFRAAFGRPDGALNLEDAFAIIHPDDRERVRERVAAASRPVDPVPYDAEYRVVHPDGSIHWVTVAGRANFSPAGSGGVPTSLDGTLIDITERKRIEEERERLISELEIERGRLQTFFRLAPAFIAVLRGRDLVFEYVNDAYYSIVGHRPIVGLPLAQALPEVVGGEEGRDYDRLLLDIMDSDSARTFNERPVSLQRIPDGPLEERFLDLAYLPLREADGTVSGVLVHGVDVTESVLAKIERERLVADLAAEREMLDTILTLSPSFVAIIRGENLTFEYANPAYMEAVGRTDLVGRTLVEALPEVVAGGVAGQEHDRFLHAVMADGKTIAFPQQPVQLETTPGALEERVLDFTYLPLRDRDGTTTGVLVHGVDVTDRARAERDIAEREELFRTVFEQAPDDAILVMDVERTLTAWNPAAERVMGWTAGEALGQPADLIFTPEDRAKGAPLEEIEKAAREGKAEDERWHLRKDGTRFWGSGTMNALHDAQGEVRGYLKVFRDATARYEEAKTLAFLRLLTDALIDQRDFEGIVGATERMLGEHLGASRVFFAEASPDGETVAVRHEWGPQMPSLVGTHRLDDFGAFVAEELRAGRTHVSHDAIRESGPESGLPAVTGYQIGSGVSVPVVADGRLASLVVVHQSVARAWTADEVALVRQVADRIASEIERARAEAALRTSQERFRAAQETAPEPFTIEEAVRDERGRIVDFRWVYMNPAAERLCGESLVGERAGERRPGQSDTKLFDACARTVETGEPFTVEIPLAFGERDYYMRLAVSKVGDGVATSFTDITQRYVEAQTLAFLSLLTEAVIDQRDPDAILATVERMMGQYLGVSRVTFGEFADDEETFVVRMEWGPQVPSVLGTHRLPTLGRRINDNARAGRTDVVRDAEAEFADDPGLDALRAARVRSAVSVPILKDGRLVSLFVAHQDTPREWTDDEIDLVRQVADRLAAEIERARAEAALRTSEERFRQLVELSPVTVWFGEPDGGLSYISQDFYNATGLSPEEALPTGWASTVHPEDVAHVVVEWEAARRDETMYDTEFRIRNRDGEYRWISARALPVRDAAGAVTGWLGSNNDIQDRKNLEETLQGRIDERTEELQRAVREAEGFNYSISHDLRSPLRAMAATSSILLEEIGGGLGEDHREMLVRQNENAKRLGRLIDELLRLSRLARVQVNREPLDMTQKAHRVIDELRDSGTANGCVFEIQEGMAAEGDPGLVRTVLQNLIGNACKFSREGGTVRVGQTDAVFWVRDDGVGFDMRFAPKIFLPFERLVTEGEFPGTGIGLANVKRIVERHEGRVWVESEPGKGAVFFFTLE